MGGGQEEASREARLIDAIENAAYDLADALLATGDPMFGKVNGGGIRAANEELRRTGYKLVPIDRQEDA